jgi:hypothetical protein
MRSSQSRTGNVKGTPVRKGAIFIVFVLAALAATSAWAQQRKKLTLDDLVIEGNIQKPEAFFILPRSNLDLSDLERREDLKARIIEAVSEPPL